MSLDDPREALRKAIQDANEVLVTATTILPLHKKTLTLSRTKLFIEEHSGVGTVSITHLRREDLLSIDGSVGPISGFIKISTNQNTPGEIINIGPFHRKDTIKLKRIIQGYIYAFRRKIDISSIPTEELKAYLYELGTDDRTVH